jgi:serine phosphatase RsbU (regulator of sigma subunit)
MGLYNSQTIAEGMQWQKGNFIGMSLLSIGFVWFVLEFTRRKFNIFAGALVTIFTVFIPITIFFESPLTLSMENQMPRTFEVGDLLKVTYNEVEPGLILTIFMGIIFIGIIYLTVLLIKHYRKEKEKGMLPIIYTSIFFFVIAAADLLNAAGLLKFVYLVEYGFMLIVLSMAFALLSRFVDLHEAVEELNIGLEIKVKERTLELEQARDALWGEMQLAKKIQTVLLPTRPEIQGYEISAFMAPAEEVGGDYYDIINIDGLDWIVIGDVSGHGVSAGLVMMMVQTSIHSVLSAKSNLKPSRLLMRVNEVISENIKRLGEDKYMTITAFACIKNGKFHFSGLHQDIMVYRSSNNLVELIETEGMWIGIFDSLEGMVGDNVLKLDKGDTMLIYTDGITEAWRKGSQKDNRDPESEMFGEERLKKLFQEMGTRPTEEIKQGILAELENYQTADDITMVVMRRVD